MIRTQILLTPTLSEVIREIARKEGESLSAVVRSLLEKALALSFKRKKTGADTLLEMAKHAVKGGPKDLSTNDDYLYGQMYP